MRSGLRRQEFHLLDAAWRDFKESHCPAGSNPPENHAWRWESKSRTEEGGTYKFLVLEYAGEIEGAMMLCEQPVFGRKEETLGQPVLYIEYLETAPWNQFAYVGKHSRFRGVGTSLLSAAIEESVRYGCEGRLALHSLDAARQFYIDQGFENLGYDPEVELDYFELSGKVLED